MGAPDVSPRTIEFVTAVRGRVPVVDQLDPARTALVVIDMQHFFLDPDSPVEVPAARGIVDNINRLAAALRAAGGTVAWVRMTFPDGELEHRWTAFLPVNSAPDGAAAFAGLQPGSHGHALWPDLAVDRDDLVVDKRRFSAFIQGSSELHELLQARDVDTIVVVGTLTNVCCESTARDAMMLDYRVVMVDDANATLDEQAHRATLDSILTFFGDVRPTDDVVAMLAPVAAS